MKKYFDIHCDFSDDYTSYSIFAEITTNKTKLSKAEVIDFCVTNNLFSETGDEAYVDKITQITKKEYNQLTN